MDVRNKLVLLNQVNSTPIEKPSKLPLWAVSIILGAGISFTACNSSKDQDQTPPVKTPDDRSAMKAAPVPDSDMKSPPVPMYGAPIMKTVQPDPTPPEYTEYGVPPPQMVAPRPAPVPLYDVP
ncbi:hypothetical protein KKF34_14110 [Myxococcota bacterium]|nr:hypothetical protein [Myxococcota bacterium]MBU1379636.1 hypothetical protein [Myxococcota bacterium]MBU1498007.1 hypothetical protein [Myxococcota bacterium]